jgi:ethanolamine utilization microcompartment shell protein EutS
MCMSDSLRPFGLEIGFIDRFSTRLVTTFNYSAIADLHALQISRAHRLIISVSFRQAFPGNDL